MAWLLVHVFRLWVWGFILERWAGAAVAAMECKLGYKSNDAANLPELARLADCFFLEERMQLEAGNAKEALAASAGTPQFMVAGAPA